MNPAVCGRVCQHALVQLRNGLERVHWTIQDAGQDQRIGTVTRPTVDGYRVTRKPALEVALGNFPLALSGNAVVLEEVVAALTARSPKESNR